MHSFSHTGNPLPRKLYFQLSPSDTASRHSNCVTAGRTMAHAVGRRPPTAKPRVRARVGPCGICDGQSGTVTDFPPSTSVFPCQFHSSSTPLLGKGQKVIIFIVITGLHNKTWGCGASVASAAGALSTKKKMRCLRGRSSSVLPTAVFRAFPEQYS
jgi:hypothetical protein